MTLKLIECAPITRKLAARYTLDRIPESLDRLAQEGHNALCPAAMSTIGVGMATCGQTAGAGYRYELLVKRPDFTNTVIVRQTGCLGACFDEPLVDVRTPDGRHHLFSKADSDTHWPIIHTALKRTAPRAAKLVLREQEPGLLTGFGDLVIEGYANRTLAAFFEAQTRRVMEHCGLIDPFSLPEYIATGGYFTLAKTLFTLCPEQVVDEITASGLRGRGGGGFLAGSKWRQAATSQDRVRILIANADEGDPSAYMDRTLMESDPHRIIEGMLLAAYAIGAHQAWIFVRREYPLSVKTLRQAMDDARAAGLLGRNILGTDFSLDIGLVQSAGAFVCGEETALLAVMQGERGEPHPRPPYPAEHGYDGHPTVINNIETLAAVPRIMAYGAAAFRADGNADSPGTKIFCLTGDVPNTGCIEVPLGIRSSTVVETIGGADPDKVKALQIGGPSGGIVPYTDFVFDFSTITAIGAMIGSGGMVVFNRERCLVDMARHFTAFMGSESCGRCLFCRDGLARLEHTLTRLTTGAGTPADLTEIDELCRLIPQLSACGLGRAAVNPPATALHYFREEFAAHVDGVCPAASCKALIRFEINYDACTDCSQCVMKYCPVNAIKRDPALKGPRRYRIDHDLCRRCRTCARICPRSCIMAVPRKAWPVPGEGNKI